MRCSTAWQTHAAALSRAGTFTACTRRFPAGNGAGKAEGLLVEPGTGSGNPYADRRLPGEIHAAVHHILFF